MKSPADDRRGRKRSGATLRGSLLLASLLAFASTHADAATWVYPGFSDTQVVTTLTQPTDFTWTPDGRMLILERAGFVRVVVGGVLQGTPALNHTALTGAGPSEAGFLGIALHPDFATTGELYIYYTRNSACPISGSPNRCNRISKFTMTGNTISAASEVVILDNISAANGNHNGGTILIGPDGKLWAAPGDSGTGGCKAQNLAPGLEGSLSGKVLRMELDGSPAAGNPYIGDATKEQRIFAYGFRNPFRFSFRPSNGVPFAGDVGQSSREEIDAVVAGGNYGWPMMEGMLGNCSSLVCPVQGGSCIAPVIDYPRSVGGSISGGVFVSSPSYAAVSGAYVFGDFISNVIKFLNVDADNVAIGGLQDLATSANGPVAFKEGPDGLLHYAGYFSGAIHRVNPPAANFHTLAPCRAADTRNPPGPYGGPALAANSTRTFNLANQCGIPASARTVSLNVTVTEGTTAGHLRLHPGGSPTPGTSTINYGAFQTRANNALLPVGPSGGLSVFCFMQAGTVHVILDVNGYLE